MEKWETLMQQYPNTIDQRTFIKTLKIAHLVLEEDLAEFELDWFINTLLYEPVKLFHTIDTKRTTETWAQSLEAAFKLLAVVVIRHGYVVDQHYEDIVQICQLHYDPKTYNQALICLTQVMRRSATNTIDAERYIDQLLCSETCKAQLASFVGTICEKYPEQVSGKAEIILRSFLSTNMLDSNSNTNIVMCNVLQGLAGLFKNFGDDLPTSELRLLYDKLIKDFLLRPKCDRVVLQILSNYSALFAEQLRAGVVLRRGLWRELATTSSTSTTSSISSTANNDSYTTAATHITPALHAIYRAIFQQQNKQQITKIIDEEVIPQLKTSRLCKYTALRVLALAKKEHHICVEVDVDSDVHVLEFELRHGKLTYALADDIAWCLESNVVESEQLLQTAIMFFTNLPKTKVRGTVVYNLFAAPDHIRKSSVIFLTTESCQDAISFEKFLPLWKMIFDTDEEGDEVLDGSKLVFEDFMEYIASLLEMFLDEQHEVFPERLSRVMCLCGEVSRAHVPAPHSAGPSGRVLRLARDVTTQYGAAPALLTAAAHLALHLNLEHTQHFYDSLDVDACMDEELLQETCLALVHAPDGLGRVDNVLDALQMTVSNSATPPRVLSVALRKLDVLLSDHQQQLNQNVVDQILYQVGKLRTRSGANGKHDRILRRDVLMFLGKFGKSIESGREVTAGSSESLVLSVPNQNDGVTYNIELREILQLAEAEEDVDALRSILAVVCANRCWLPGVVCSVAARSGRGLRACAALARARTAPATALTHVLPYIMSERRWSVRRLLAEGVVSLLADEGDDVLSAALERALLLTETTLHTSKRAGLDLIEALMVPLNDNNDLSQRLLPDIIIHIVKAYEINSDAAFDAASQVFFDKIALFDELALKKLKRGLIEAITSDKMEVVTDDMRIYKITVKKVLELLNRLDINEMDVVEINIKRLYVAVQARRLHAECLVDGLVPPGVVEQALDLAVDEDDWFQVEAYFMFLEEFSNVLLTDNADRTTQLIANIISRLDPETIKRVKKSLTSCVKLYLKNSKGQKLVDLSVNKWCSKVPLQQITQDLQDSSFNYEQDILVSALNAITGLECSLDEANKAHIRQWPRLLIKMWKQNIEYPTDLLQVGMRSLTRSEVKNIILNGQGTTADSSDEFTQFCRINMCVFFEYLAREPYVLAESDMEKCCVLLNDVVQWYVRRKCPSEWSDAVLDLVNQLWPKYENQVPFGRKVALLQDMRRLTNTLSPNSAPMRWAVDQMAKGNVGEMISLVAVLPPGDTYKSSLMSVAAHLPTRLRELSGVSNAVFRALVDAAADGDTTLLDIVAVLASGDDTWGWWMEALECCAASLALRAERHVYDRLHHRCWTDHTLGVCHRLYLPLLRHSSSQFCEQYLPEVVVNAMSKFKGKQMRPAPVFAYQKQVNGYATAFYIIQLAIEQLSTQTLELCSSRVNTLLGATKPWHVISEVAKLSVSFMKQAACPDGADQTLRDLCREAQCGAYACACAALRRRRPAEKLYAPLFEPTLWSTLVDPYTQLDLPLPSQGVVRTVRHTVGAEDTDNVGGVGSAGTARSVGTLSRSTYRSRLFLRTLSQNPLEHDQEPVQEDGPEQQEIEVRESWLNSLRVSRDLTALVRHVTARRFTEPRRLADALLHPHPYPQHIHYNAKLMLAQVICNCSGELSPFAVALRPALLQVLADADDADEPLNSLHLHILNTLSQWRDEVTLADPTHLNTAIVKLLQAIINHRQQKYTFNILLDCLHKLLEVYGPMVNIQWTLFERYFHHANDDVQKCCLKILQTFVKNKVYIMGMVLDITDTLEGQRELSPELARLVGGALAVRHDDVALHALTTLLDRAAGDLPFLRTLYYAQAHCDWCTTHQHFKKVNNILPRVPKTEKKKCLRIMASFLAGPRASSVDYNIFSKLQLDKYLGKKEDDDIIEEAIKVVKSGLHLMDTSLKHGLVELVADHCRHLSKKVREAALDVVTKAFEELQPSGGSVVLNVTEPYSACVVRAVSSAGPSLSRRVSAALSQHLTTRFAESLYLAVYLPVMTGAELDLCEVATTFLETLFSGIRSHEAFKNIRLRNEPLQTTVTSGISNFASSSQNRTTGNTIQVPGIITDTSAPAVDVQTPVDDILSSLFQFAKVNATAAVRLVCAVTRCVMSGEGGAGGPARAGALVAELLEAPHTHTHVQALTPLLLQLARDLLPYVCQHQGFQESVEKLRKNLMGAEGEDLVTLLHEEVLLKTRGPELFVLGSKHEEMDVDVMTPERLFSLKDLVSSFGKLSNWDNLTLQQRRRIVRDLPPLWTDEDTFKTKLEEYEAGDESWFDKLVWSWRESRRVQAMHWLRDLQRTPTRHFLVSAVTEAIQWQNSSKLQGLYHGVPEPARDQCLAEWAARLMLRATFLRKYDASVLAVTCLDELRWCVRASETTLHNHVALCALRHKQHQDVEEQLSWALQHLIARRTHGLERDDVTILAKVLEDAEKYVSEYPCSYPAVLLRLNHLTLQLRRDLHRVSISNVEETLEVMNQQCSRIDTLGSRSKKTVHDTLQLAMACYYELWTTTDDVQQHECLLRGMCAVVVRAVQTRSEGGGAAALVATLVATLVDRARAHTHPHLHTDQLLDTIEMALPCLESCASFAAEETVLWARSCSHTQLSAHVALSSAVAEAAGVAGAAGAGRKHMFRACLQLLCDPRHTLATYCKRLATAIYDNDPVQWNKTFETMSQKLFENQFLGTDFKLLGKHKSTLYAIKEYDGVESSKKLEVLRVLERQLQRAAPASLRLSQLCDTLASQEVRADSHLAALLQLPPGLGLVSFDEQVHVYTVSARRPCLVRAVLSDGSRRRYLHKFGDRPRLDAAVLHVAATLLPHVTTYTVKPLSEDCALIEFLEDHVKLDTLIGESCDLSQLSVPRDDEDLIVRPVTERLQAFRDRCDKVPAHALRTSLEKRSSSLEDFLRKKSRFLESVASTTLLCWILGVGDRHTQNVLIGADGGVACVDWADALQHGAHELPPARLTRTMLALLDTHVLESRLQQQLSMLRDSATSVLAVIKFSFHWMGEEFTQKFKYIEGLVRGTYLPHHVTKMALQEKRVKHFDKYMELLDDVFKDYELKDRYSVEEQVSCLLRQCTDPRILSVTRYGWEPWL